jgi:hypothetical protein
LRLVCFGGARKSTNGQSGLHSFVGEVVRVVRQLLQVWEVLMVVAHLHGDVLVGRRNLCQVMVLHARETRNQTTNSN